MMVDASRTSGTAGTSGTGLQLISGDSEIPARYQLHQPGRDQNFTLAEFADTVTPDLLEFFLLRVAQETIEHGDLRNMILTDAAKTLGVPVDGLRDRLDILEHPGRFKVEDAGAWLQVEPTPPNQVVENVFDCGDKVAVIGGSKMRKSFFFLQMLLSICTGRDFLGRRTPKPRRVLLVQLEIQPDHYLRRLHTMTALMGLESNDLAGKLFVINGRGLDVNTVDLRGEICRLAKWFHVEIVAFDPFYKLLPEGENGPGDLKPLLSCFDYLARQTGAAVLYVHHDSKGEAGDRNLTDRGAGSGVLGRDYDACFALTAHSSGEDGACVVDVAVRNYPPIPGCTIFFQEGFFELRSDLAPTKRDSRNRRRSQQLPLESYREPALTLIREKPMSAAVFKDQVKRKCALTDERYWALVKYLVDEVGSLAKYSVKGRGKNNVWIGSPEQIETLKNGG